MIINGTDLTTLGFIPGPRTFPTIGSTVKVQAVAGRLGGFVVGQQYGTPGSGQLIVEGNILGTDHADLLSKIDAISAIVRPSARRPSVITFTDRADRAWTGLLDATSSMTVLQKRGYLTRVATVRLAFTLADTRAVAVTSTTVGLVNATPALLYLGTARSEVVLTLSAPSSDVVVSVLDASANPIRRFEWNTTGGVVGSWVLNSDLATLTLGGANVLADMTFSSVFPVLDPEEGAASIRVDGAPTGSISLTYSKCWWG